MAVIQGYHFLKDGSIDFNCSSVNPINKIECEALIYFSGPEIGKSYWVVFKLRTPNGTIISLNAWSHPVTSGTNSFISASLLPVSQWGTGTYTLTGIVYGAI